MAMANSLLENQIQQLAQDEINDLKNVKLTDGVVKILDGAINVPLAEEDKEVFRLLGYSEAEIRDMHIEDLGNYEQNQKLSKAVNSFAERKEREVKDGVYEESIPGLLSSTVGLGFAAALGIVVGVRCSTQPSALAFAGTSAAWAGLELLNWNSYKFDMKKLEKLGSAEEEINKIAQLVHNIQEKIKAMEPHAKDLTSINKADGAIDGIDTQLGGIKSDIIQLREILRSIDSNQLEAFRSLYESLRNSADVTKKKSRNAKVAAVGYTAASGLAIMESFNVIGGAGGSCVTEARYHPKHLFMDNLKTLFPKAFALNISVGDLDKVGIPIGAGAAAAYLAFEGQWANAIYSSGMGRSITFGIMAGNAYYASAKLKNSAEFLDKQAKEIGIFTDFFTKRLRSAINIIDMPVDLITYAQEELLPKAKELLDRYHKTKDTLETLEQIANATEGGGADSNGNTNLTPEQIQGLIQSETGQNVSIEDIQEGIELIQDDNLGDLGIDEFISYQSTTLKKSWLDYLIPQAMAQTSAKKKIKPSCFVLRPEFLRMDPQCRCRASNSCSTAPFMKLEPKKDIKGSDQTISFANQIMKANRLILTGAPGQGLALYDKLERYAPAIERNNFALAGKDPKKTIAPGVKGFHKTLIPALKDYYQTGESHPGLAVTHKPTKISKEKRREQLVERIRNRVALAQYLQGKKTTVQASQKERELTFSKKDFVSPLKGEAIQRDSSLDIFQIIRQRYLKILNEGRL